MKKKKLKPTDGLGPKEIKQIRIALRRVWSWSYSRKLVVNRCIGKDGFPRCEQCKKKTPAIKVDHIVNVGDVDSGYIGRLFVPSKRMQGLCKKCHDGKTKWDRKIARDLTYKSMVRKHFKRNSDLAYKDVGDVSKALGYLKKKKDWGF